MIHKLKIIDISKTPFSYMGDDTLLVQKGEFNFQQGLNLIIGENGSGKSTLLNMLAFGTFSKKGETKLTHGLNPTGLREYVDTDGETYKGFEILNDFRIKVFKLMHDDEMDQEDNLSSFENFGKHFNSKHESVGEKLLSAINMMFEHMFSDDLSSDLGGLTHPVNDTWKKYQTNLKSFIADSQEHETEPIFGALMDEPDRNLDVENIEMIKTILTNQKENGQMIVTLHNPLLIYAVIKHGSVNVIELSEGYKDKIMSTIENLVK